MMGYLAVTACAVLALPAAAHEVWIERDASGPT